MWIALDELYILEPETITLSLISLELSAINLNFSRKMTPTSHFWKFPEWQPYMLGKKPEHILESLDGAIM